MARDPVTPADPTPDRAKDTEVDPSNTLATEQEGLTPEEYLDALDKIPGGVFFDEPADVGGALDPGEEVHQFSDLPIADRQVMTRKFAELRRKREASTTELAPGDATKLRDQITAGDNG